MIAPVNLLVTEENMHHLAVKLAVVMQQSSQPLCLLLYGDIGAGKSFFARHLIQHLAGYALYVPSPTFTICQYYDIANFGLYHVDCYRITSADEWLEIGDADLQHHHYIIEWPEILTPFYPNNYVMIQLDYVPDNDEARYMTSTIIGDIEPAIVRMFANIDL